MVIKRDMIFGGGKGSDQKDDDIVYTTEDGISVDRDTALKIAEQVQRERIRKKKYRNSDLGKEAKIREQDKNKLIRRWMGLVDRGYCICGENQDACKIPMHLESVIRMQKILGKI